MKLNRASFHAFIGYYVSLLERCLFESLTHFVIGLFIFSLWSRKSTYFALCMSHCVSRKMKGRIASILHATETLERFDGLISPCNLVSGIILVVGEI